MGGEGKQVRWQLLNTDSRIFQKIVTQENPHSQASLGRDSSEKGALLILCCKTLYPWPLRSQPRSSPPFNSRLETACKVFFYHSIPDCAGYTVAWALPLSTSVFQPHYSSVITFIKREREMFISFLRVSPLVSKAKMVNHVVFDVTISTIASIWDHGCTDRSWLSCIV